MRQKITLLGETVEYFIYRSHRARHLRIIIGWGKGVVVTLPMRMSERMVEPFLQEKAGWILKVLKKLEKHKTKFPIRISEAEYIANKDRAQNTISGRVTFFNQFYRFQYKNISIRNQKTIWGSCTRQGKLQFNYKLLRLPQRLLDYVVVHELCHLQEHNHSEKFWRLVEKVLPDHKQLRKVLRNHIMQVE